MADKTPATMTVKLRAEYSTGKGDPAQPGEKIRLPYKEAVKLIDSGMAVDPDSPEAALAGSDEARTAELIGEMTLLRGEVDRLGELTMNDAKTITELRGELSKLSETAKVDTKTITEMRDAEKVEAKTITELRGQLAKAEAEIKKLKA